jgi:hypothetical protein
MFPCDSDVEVAPQLSQFLKNYQQRPDGNNEFNRIERSTEWSIIGFQVHQGYPRISKSVPKQDTAERKEKEKGNDVQDCPFSWRKTIVNDVHIDMGSVKADVCAANEVVDGKDALRHPVGPYGRGIEYVPGYNLIYQHRHTGP